MCPGIYSRRVVSERKTGVEPWATHDREREKIMTRTRIDPFCVGNSHALIVVMYSATSARCACGTTLVRLVDGTWVHGDTHKKLCSPYECECGRRH